MPFKITILFQDTTGTNVGGTIIGGNHIGGWSESVYTNITDVNLIRQKLFTAGSWGQGLCPARAALLPQSASIVGQRITQVLPRLGKAQTTGNQFPGPSFATDVPQMALQCSAPGDGVANVRHFSIRAIPDGQVINGEYLPDQAFFDAQRAYFAELINWRFLGQVLTAPYTSVYTVDANGLVTQVGVPGVVPGDTVQFSGLTDLAGNNVRGKFLVKDNGPGSDQFSVNGWPTGLVTTGGKYRVVLYDTFLMVQPISADRITVRKVGRPFGQYRGRRSKSKAIGL